MKFLKFLVVFVLVLVITPACSSNSNNIREEGVVAQLIDNQWTAGDTARYFRECADIVYEYQRQSGFTAFTDTTYNLLENICDEESRHFSDDTAHPLSTYDKECVFDAHLNWTVAGIADLLSGEEDTLQKNFDFDLADLDDCFLILDEKYKS